MANPVSQILHLYISIFVFFVTYILRGIAKGGWWAYTGLDFSKASWVLSVDRFRQEKTLELRLEIIFINRYVQNNAEFVDKGQDFGIRSILNALARSHWLLSSKDVGFY